MESNLSIAGCAVDAIADGSLLWRGMIEVALDRLLSVLCASLQAGGCIGIVDGAEATDGAWMDFEYAVLASRMSIADTRGVRACVD